MSAAQVVAPKGSQQGDIRLVFPRFKGTRRACNGRVALVDSEHDVALIELDQEAPEGIVIPQLATTKPDEGRWISWWFTGSEPVGVLVSGQLAGCEERELDHGVGPLLLASLEKRPSTTVGHVGAPLLIDGDVQGVFSLVKSRKPGETGRVYYARPFGAFTQTDAAARFKELLAGPPSDWAKTSAAASARPDRRRGARKPARKTPAEMLPDPTPPLGRRTMVTRETPTLDRAATRRDISQSVPAGRSTQPQDRERKPRVTSPWDSGEFQAWQKDNTRDSGVYEPPGRPAIKPEPVKPRPAPRQPRSARDSGRSQEVRTRGRSQPPRPRAQAPERSRARSRPPRAEGRRTPRPDAPRRSVTGSRPPAQRPVTRGPTPDLVQVASCELMSFWGGPRVSVGAFLLQVHPVTQAEYAAFLSATGWQAPVDWSGPSPPAGREQHPIGDVRLEDARRYAAWCGLRLPTHLEWEAAMRGSEGRAFPWGESWDPKRCNGPDSGRRETTPVGGYPDGVTACGCLDMLGNVWEWTDLDECGVAPEWGGYTWVFGGSYRHRCHQDEHGARSSVAVANHYPYLGFRCARDL